MFSRSRVNKIESFTEFKSDKHHFQKKDLTGEVVEVLFSTSCITMLAMTVETGEPTAAPKTC